MTTFAESLNYQPTELAFGTSGLRGLVTDMTDLECYLNTVGFLRFLVRHDGLLSGETVYLAGDLRDSTPRIMATVQAAIVAEGFVPSNQGIVATPALAYYAQLQNGPCVMVTGSHIPADRNGIKFYKRTGEILKLDEAAIKECVAEVRLEVGSHEASAAPFLADGSLRDTPKLTSAQDSAKHAYMQRYLRCLDGPILVDMNVVVYQHSSVSRDLLVEVFRALGAIVETVGRSDAFVSIDTENIKSSDKAYFLELIQQYPDTDLIVSTDGDGDRPFVVDERGIFHSGDLLGALVAHYLGIQEVALPVSTSDAVTQYFATEGVPVKLTRIGSPYVIDAMQKMTSDLRGGWEVNGGFLLGSRVSFGSGELAELPTRDALLPILVAALASHERGQKVSQLFESFPRRYTAAGLIDNFPNAISTKVIEVLSSDMQLSQSLLATVLVPEDGCGELQSIDVTDGARMIFDGGDVLHVRPSGNAPQLRIYATANSQNRADDIVSRGLAEPDGILRRLERAVG